MPVTKNINRQCAQVAACDFTYADLASGVYAACFDLPIGAIVTRGDLFVTTLFNSGTTDQFSIGEKIGAAAAVNTRYAALSADITATGRAAVVVPTGIKAAEAVTVGIAWTGVGAAPTAGVGKLVIEYIIDGKAEETFEA